MNHYQEELYKTEIAFCSLAKKEGVEAAFLAFAAEDAVLHRGGHLIHGHAGIKQHFEDSPIDYLSLEWSPEYIDVSSSGDLGYTYGPYTLSYRDAEMHLHEMSGTFHTVWRRQPDGSWKFVWD